MVYVFVFASTFTPRPVTHTWTRINAEYKRISIINSTQKDKHHICLFTKNVSCWIIGGVHGCKNRTEHPDMLLLEMYFSNSALYWIAAAPHH